MKEKGEKRKMMKEQVKGDDGGGDVGGDRGCGRWREEKRESGLLGWKRERLDLWRKRENVVLVFFFN